MGKRNQDYVLSGIVELDDAYFGAPKSNGKRGRGTEKTSALAAVSLTEQGHPRFLKIQVSRLDAELVSAVAQQTICPGSEIHSDALGSFRAALSEGYWAKIFNLKEMAKTVMYLQENNLTDFGELKKTCDAAIQRFNDLAEQTKAASARMREISELQRHVGAYSKTREIYAQYRKLTGRKQTKFYEQHSSEIADCQAAKRYFNSLGLKKLPSIQSLKQEYAVLLAENKKRYPEYKQAREKMVELLTAKNNVERILGVTENEKNLDRQQEAR